MHAKETEMLEVRAKKQVICLGRSFMYFLKHLDRFLNIPKENDFAAINKSDL